MHKKLNATPVFYEEPICVTIGVDDAAVICESFSDSNVENYGRSEFEW